MKRAADILQLKRLDRDLNYDEVSKKTKIPIRYLIAFETDDTSSFPDEPYCSLMVKEYAAFLGLNPNDFLCLFLRDHSRQIQKKYSRPQNLKITPQKTFSLLIILSIVAFVSYLSFEFIKFNRPPPLKVNWPENFSETIEISGVTNSESTVKINQDLVLVNLNGEFKKTINLSTPEAKIVVESRSPAGKTTVTEKIYK